MNRTSKSSVVNKTPYDLWFIEKANLKDFKIFGTRVAIHVQKEPYLKRDLNNRSGILVGYSDDIKG